MPDIDFSQWILGILIVVGAAGVQGLTGFGFALVSIPLLLYIYPSYEAILISIMLAMFILLLQAWKNWNNARWDLIWRLVGIGLPGLWIGLSIGKKMNSAHLEGLVGVSVLVYILFQFILENRNKGEQTINTKNSGEKSSRKLPKGFYLAGFISGVLTGAVGLPGPPVIAILIPFLLKETFRSTVIYYFIFIYSVTLTLALFVFKQDIAVNDILSTTAVYLIPAVVGYLIGHSLHKRINDINFKRLIYGLLIVIGTTSFGHSVLQFSNY